MRQFSYEIMKYHPFVREDDIETQWTHNRCVSFILRHGFLDYRPKDRTGLSKNRFLYVDPFSWIELEFQSIPKEGIFKVLFYNLILY